MLRKNETLKDMSGVMAPTLTNNPKNKALKDYHFKGNCIKWMLRLKCLFAVFWMWMVLLALFYYVEQSEGKHIIDMVITLVIGAIDVTLAWVMYEAVIKTNVERLHSLVIVGVIFWLVGAAFYMVHQYSHDDGNVKGSWIAVGVEFVIMCLWFWFVVSFINVVKGLTKEGGQLVARTGHLSCANKC